VKQVEEETVRKTICKLKNKRSAGLDEISNQIIKIGMQELVKPLTYIINKIISEETFPSVLKISKVKPLYKNGDKSKPENYRPVALISCFSKIIEKVILDMVIDFLNTNKVISKSQFGYQKQRSTTDAIVNLSDVVVNSKSKKVMAIFLDLSKAFDCVDHNILLKIIEKYGMRGKIGNIIESYLKDRWQCVEVSRIEEGILKEGRSKMKRLKYSVPQGSVFGPYLFIIYTNAIQKIVERMKGKVVVYVDDTNLIIEGESIEKIVQRAELILKQLNEYFASLNLYLNWGKTAYMVFQHKDNVELNIGNVKLNRVKSTKFLGMVVQDNLKWNDHVEQLVKKLNKGIFAISQVTQCLDLRYILKVYFSHFFSYVANGIELWGNEELSKENVKTIFAMQKTAVRLIKYRSYKRKTCRGVFKELKL